MKIAIKKATKKNKPEVLKLHRMHSNYWGELERGWYDSDSEQSKRYTTRKVREFFKDNRRQVFIAKNGSEAIGYALVMEKPGGANNIYEKIGFLGELFVKKEWRSKKIGKKLLGESIRWCRQRKLPVMTTDTSLRNKRAIKVYERAGLDQFHVTFRKKL